MLTTKFSTKLITVITILFLTLSSVQPALAAPTNDAFVNATVITSLPFSDTLDSSLATIEAGEPRDTCSGRTILIENTIWYRFTPTTTAAIGATLTTDFPSMLAIYSGTSLDSLSLYGMRCHPIQSSGEPLYFIAEPNTTYYFQIGGYNSSGGTVRFDLEAVPPPPADFGFLPVDPSILDTIQFTDQTDFYQFDPAASFAWDFGDGTTSSDRNPTHQYASDGDYTVQHTITTLSGGTSSTSQIVQVRTHDVAITRVVAPLSARLGQTRPITVYIKNNRYAETVQIELYKSNPNIPGGFELVGSYIQFVPVRSGNRTSAFTFNYTFTADDLAIGKVTFKAVATLVNGHDAIPSDNELNSAPPTLVKR